MNVIALDIGGTAVKYGLFFGHNEEFGQFSVYDKDGQENVQTSLYRFLECYKADVIAISVPGPFDFQTGTSNMKHKLLSLYGVGLKKILEEKFQNVSVSFVHDSTAFAFGVMVEKPELIQDAFSCVMLGTGIGYVNVVKGVVQLNEQGTPKHPLWNMRFCDGIVEDYVSTNALLTKAREKGCFFNNIKEMSVFARKGNDEILDIFKGFGKQLGRCMEYKRQEDRFNQIVIGGQISKSFDLIREGFEKETDIPYLFVKDSSSCALYGLKAYTERQCKE
ncbi:MAG: ROK family protein [Ruminococcaceae bacterium]|nr:ROK family protein [Oscillospiraceae bacterium]